MSYLQVKERWNYVGCRIAGFIAYDALQVGNDQIISISVFDTPLGVIESTPRALQWIQENIVGLIQGKPEVMVGQVGASSELDRIYGTERRNLFHRNERVPS